MSRPGRTLLATALTLLALGALTSTAGATPCPNEALREAQNATALPSCMALEMVSPPKKFGQGTLLPSFSASGERVLFYAQSALADTPGLQAFTGDPYVATREAAGWQVSATAPLLGSIVGGTSHQGGPSAFTPDLARWVQLGTTQSQFTLGVAQLFGGGLDGTFAPLSPLLQPIDNSGGKSAQFSLGTIEVSGSSVDLSTTVLFPHITSVSYLPGDPSSQGKEEETGKDRSSYVAFLEDGEPTLELLARDKDGTVYGGRCGAHIGGPIEGGSAEAAINQGAISPDGSRIYFSTRPAQPFDSGTGEGPECTTANPVRIFVRTRTEAGPQITPLLAGGPAEWEQPGDDRYEGASADGTKVYFTSPRKLSASDADTSAEGCGAELGAPKGCDLYLYDFAKPEAERLIDVSAGGTGDPTPGKGADVLSQITAISRDGSHAYFVAKGVLTTDPNPEGDIAQAGQPNLYLYDAESGETAFVGTLAAGDAGSMWGENGSFFGGAYATHDVLAFASKAPLTADDEDGGHRDVFRYDAADETLERVSKAAPGGSDNGPFDVKVNPSRGVGEANFGEQARWVSEDGQGIAFATEEPLLPGDEDGVSNPYVWKQGDLGAARAKILRAPAISPDGGEVAFSTPTPLLPQDGDTAEDIYVGRSDGGFPNPTPPTECDPLQEGACQQRAVSTQLPGAPASASFSGPGNVHEAVKCKKGFAKRNARCVKKRRRHKPRTRASHSREGGR